jgi:3-oxoacid CoA-transferase B subunit
VEELAQRVARDVEDRWVVNVGIGLPQTVIPHLVARDVILHSENGIVGLGPVPPEGEEDPDIVNAGKEFATVVPGAAFMDTATSFALIRGGRLDLALMGAYEVSAGGDLANWKIAGRKIGGIGGAADLAYGAARLWVITALFDKQGAPKLVLRCRHPVTARHVVHRVYTDYGVFRPQKTAFVPLDLPPGMDVRALPGISVATASAGSPSGGSTPSA